MRPHLPHGEVERGLDHELFTIGGAEVDLHMVDPDEGEVPEQGSGYRG
jgi:hypothetical protein